MLFPKLTFILLYVSKYKIILLTIYSNLSFYKALSGNTINGMKVCLNIDGVFELFEIVLANFHDKYSQKSKKKLLYFYPFSVFEEKDDGTMTVMVPCIMYFYIVGFMQSKLKELQLLTILENSFC